LNYEIPLHKVRLYEREIYLIEEEKGLVESMRQVIAYIL